MLAPAKEAFTPVLFSRVRSHLYSQLLCMGRHTITGLLSTQGRVHQDWSADYRLYANKRLDPQVLFDCVKGELRARRKERNKPLVLAVDDSLLRKRGSRAHGVKWMRDPLGPPFSVNFVRGQRVVPLVRIISARAATFRTCIGNTGWTPTRFWMPAPRRW